MKAASSILCQGKEYVPFVGKLSSTPCFYYPNYLLNSVYKRYSDNGRANASRIKLVYFGRVAESKNIEFLIDVCNELKNNISFDMEIIGDGDKEYLVKLEEKILKLKLSESVFMYGRCQSDELMSKLKEKHFFVFPSNEAREGHSNSLTEAMSCGVVPIASDAGFNRSIINNDGLIIDDFVPALYASKIREILNVRGWEHLSRVMHKRVGDYYTENAVIDVIQKAHTVN